VDTTQGRVGVAWTLAYTLVNDIGFANIVPIGLALYSRVAPKQIVGLVLGVYYLHLFLGNSFVGWLAGFMDIVPNRDFWLLHAALVLAAGVLLLVVRLAVGRIVAPEAILGKESVGN
jgi:POT family proton-dependent oligopeptide transporter